MNQLAPAGTDKARHALLHCTQHQSTQPGHSIYFQVMIQVALVFSLIAHLAARYGRFSAFFGCFPAILRGSIHIQAPMVGFCTKTCKSRRYILVASIS